MDRYVDGDSFHAFVDGKKTEIRLIGADTPEAYGDPKENQKVHATHASDFFKTRITENTEFEVIPSGDHTHGRALAWILVDGKELGLELVEKGLAVPYMYCSDFVCKNEGYDSFLKSAHVEDHLKACAKARKDKLGIWDDTDPKHPALEKIPQEYRRVTKESGRGTKYFIADYFKKTYVTRNLQDYTEAVVGIDYCDRVLFDNEEDVKAAGYKEVANTHISTQKPQEKSNGGNNSSASKPPPTKLKPFVKHKGTLKDYGDGDTITARVDGEEFKLRFIGADTPETYGNPGENQKDHGDIASDFIKSEITGATQFEVMLTGRASYDRYLGWIYLNGEELSQTLVEKGYAVPYMYCDKSSCEKNGYKKFLKTHQVKAHLDACHQARKNRIGIWKDTPKLAALKEIPQEYRRVTLDNGQKTRYIIGSFSKKLFVEKGQDDYTESTLGIDYCDRVLFDSEGHAEDAGYKKAKAVPVK